MTSILKLLRPQQWVKNLFVFLPLFFDRHLFDVEYLLPCVLVFFAFCFAASGIYCLKDIIDVEADRKHPEKCKRPIASGAVSQRAGYIIMAVCFIISLALLVFIHRPDGRSGLPPLMQNCRLGPNSSSVTRRIIRLATADPA